MKEINIDCSFILVNFTGKGEMSREKTIKYISETPITDMVDNIKNKNLDINHVIASSLEARKEFGLKVQQFVDELSKLLPKLEVGMILEAKEDCMNNFRKGQKLEITKINHDGDYVIDGVVGVSEETVHTYFNIVGLKR